MRVREPSAARWRRTAGTWGIRYSQLSASGDAAQPRERCACSSPDSSEAERVPALPALQLCEAASCAARGVARLRGRSRASRSVPQGARIIRCASRESARPSKRLLTGRVSPEATSRACLSGSSSNRAQVTAETRRFLPTATFSSRSSRRTLVSWCVRAPSCLAGRTLAAGAHSERLVGASEDGESAESGLPRAVARSDPRGRAAGRAGAAHLAGRAAASSLR